MGETENYKFMIINNWCSRLISPVSFLFASVMAPFFFLSFSMLFTAELHSIPLAFICIVGFLALFIFTLGYFRKLFVSKYFMLYYSDAVIKMSSIGLSINIINCKEADCRSYIIAFDDMLSIGYCKRLSYAWNRGSGERGYNGKGLIIRTKCHDKIILKIEKPYTYLQINEGIHEYSKFCRAFLHQVNLYNRIGSTERIKYRKPIIWSLFLRTLMFIIFFMASLAGSVFAGGGLGFIISSLFF